MIVQRLIRLAKDVFVYGFGSALTGVVGIILIPILTHLLSPRDYGSLDLLITVVFLANVLLTFGFDTASAILFFEHQDPLHRRRVLNTTVTVALCFALFACGLLFPFRETLASAVLHDATHATAVALTIAIIPFSIALGLLLAGLRYRFRKGHYIATQATYFSLTIVLAILFLTVFRLGLVGYLLAWFLSAVVATCMAFAFYKDFRVSFHRSTLRALFRLGLPVVPAGLAGWSLSLVDRFFVNAQSADTLGLYSLGVKIASIIGLGVAALQLAWGPFALSIAREEGARETYAKTLTIVTVFGVFATLVLAAFSPELVSLVSASSFHEAGRAVGILALGLVAYGSYYIVSIGVSIAKRTSLISVTTMIAAAAHIGLNFILIPRIGIYGAALASVIAYLLSSLLLAYISGRVYPIPYEWRRVATAWLIGAGGVAVFATFPLTISFGMVVMKIAAIIVLLGLLMLFRVFERGELRSAIALMQVSFQKFRH